MRKRKERLDIYDKKGLFISYVGAIWLAVMLNNGWGFAECLSTGLLIYLIVLINYFSK